MSNLSFIKSDDALVRQTRRNRNMNRQRQQRDARVQAFRTQNVAQVARSVVRSELGRTVEKKSFVVEISGTGSSAGVIVPLLNVAQGDTDTTRDGDAIAPLKLDWRMTALSTGAYLLRYVLFQWLPPTTPTVADILEPLPAAGGPTHFSPYSHDTRQSYRVIYDRAICGGTDWHITNVDVQPAIPLAKMQTIYVNGTTTGTNKYYACIISNAVNASYAGTSKVWFNDA